MTAQREPLWYKDAIIYQTHLRAFADSKDDGIGDFNGLTSRLDYIHDLGVTAIWLLPFYPSPLKDDGYDIADYCDVNPIYGDLADFKTFLKEAHARNLKVITELVLNHTSDQHAWFQRARRAPAGSRERNYYVWSDNPNRYREARIIFKDFETSNWAWDEVAGAYYWHRFYSHQPDLNFDSPDVQRAVLQALDFWLKMGVDGLRLDAVPYLYERDGTSCENLPETHQFLKRLRAHIDARFSDRMLLAEANQWPEDAVAYFGQGDECHMAFHFPLMPRLFMAVQQEDRYPIIDILQQTPAIPDSCQWTIFLRNHDELTLEMVTDEERDYMYRVYAIDPQARLNLGIRRRLAPLLGNNRRKIELMNGLLLSLPGTPVIYYGDELGMGDNIYLGDRDSVRTPMQWSADRNAGFSRANPQKLYLPVVTDPEFHYTAINVETQQNSPHSLLWWMKRLIALRKRYKAFSRGSLEFLSPENSKVVAFVRRFEGETILVVANLSRYVQYAELDLSAYKGLAPTEMFGQTRFPPINDTPYVVMLGPHGFYWFCLSCPAPGGDGPALSRLPACRVAHSWSEALAGHAQAALEAALPQFLVRQRWFGGKARTIQSAEVRDVVDFSLNGHDVPMMLVFVKVGYTEGEPESYLVPLGLARGTKADELLAASPALALAAVQSADPDASGVIYDASRERVFWTRLHDIIARRRRLPAAGGQLVAWHNAVYRQLRGKTLADLVPSILRAEQSNSAAILGDVFLAKLFRKADPGVNPDLEIGQLLTDKPRFPHAPAVAGAVEFRPEVGEPITVAIFSEYLRNSQQGWDYALNEIGRYFERVGTEFTSRNLQEDLPPGTHWYELIDRDPTPLAQKAIGPFLHAASQLGHCTAELHQRLAGADHDPAFAPEPFTPFYQRGLFQSMRNHARRVLTTLKRQLPKLAPPLQPDARRIVELENTIVSRFRQLVDRKITALRIRCHGDYHLGQVLHTGKDFAIIDFEGEPMRPISERRIKRSPLRDVAGMLRSFHYASQAGLLGDAPGVVVRPEDFEQLAPWAWYWYLWTSATFVRAYLAQAKHADFLPEDRAEVQFLLDVYLLDKALYELNYELNNRPDWITIPIRGILDLMNVPRESRSTPPGVLQPPES